MACSRLTRWSLAIVCLAACAGGADEPPTTSAFDPTTPTNPTSTGMVDTGMGPGVTSMPTADGTSGSPPDDSCCQVAPTPGCGAPEIEACVCTIAPTCCQDAWTDDCVGLAGDPCGDPACSLPPATSSTGQPGDSSTGEPPPMVICDQLAAQQGWRNWRCEAGGGSQCNGMGTPTLDCDFCCELCGEAGDQSCGDYATSQGWGAANCEWNGNGACGGAGTPTCDCDFCCEVG